MLTTGEPVGASGGGGGAAVGQVRSGASMSNGSFTLNFTGEVANLVSGASGTIVHCTSAGFPAGVTRVSSITTNTGGSGAACSVVLSSSATAAFSGGTVYFVASNGVSHNGANGGVPGGGGGGGGSGVYDVTVETAGANGGAGGAGAVIIESYW